MAPRREHPLQQLHNLDRTSSEFHEQLSDFLRGEEYQRVFPSLKSEDLTWLVEYLDSVSIRTISLHPALRTSTGSCRYSRSWKSPVLGIPA